MENLMYIINIFTQLVETLIASKALKDIIDSIPQNFKFYKAVKNILIIILVCFVICMCITAVYTNINIKKTINEITPQSEFETEIVSDDYESIINDNRGEDYYIDAEKCKSQIKTNSIIMAIVSLTVIIAIMMVIKKLKNFKIFATALIMIVMAYNVISPLFIMPIEKPVSVSITLPIYESVSEYTLGNDYSKYTTTTTSVKTADITSIDYYGEIKTQYMFKEILICTDICMFIVIGLCWVEKRWRHKI